MNELPRGLKMATVWGLIGVALFLAVQGWQRQQAATRFSADGGVIEIRRSGDGHYHWPARLNGQPVEFLVDTGATGSAIPEALARRLDLPQVGTVRTQTAGGLVTGSIVLGDLELSGGVRAERLRIAALPELSAPLLGMDVLGRLRWQQDGDRLRIEPRAP